MRIRRFGAIIIVCAVAAGCASGGIPKDTPYWKHREYVTTRRAMEAYQRGDFDRAVSKYEDLVRIHRSVDDRSSEAVDLINMARLLVMTGETGRATEALARAEVLVEETGERQRLVDIHFTWAKAEYLAGGMEGTLARVEESLKIARETGYKRTGAGLNLKGLALRDSGRVDQAREAFEEAHRLSRSAGSDSEAANAMRALATIETMSGGDTDRAVELLERAYELDRARGDTGKISLDLEAMAEARLAQGRADEAARLLERSYLVSVSGGLDTRAAESLGRLVEVLGSEGRSEEAARYEEIREGILNPERQSR